MIWQQVYNPFNSMFWSTFSAAVPVVVLMGLLAAGANRLHLCLSWVLTLGGVAIP